MVTQDILTRRLRNFAPLEGDDVALLARLSTERPRKVPARTDIAREGDPTQVLRISLSGCACRYRTLEDGRRQILGILLPGDTCDLNNDVFEEMDHSIGSLTPLHYAELSHDRLARWLDDKPRLARAFWWHMMTTISIQREWTLNLSRNAFERIGNLLCELVFRLRAVGLNRGNRIDFPVTQIEIGEATGLTPVHVNRTLQDMRSEGLIVLKDRVLDIPDIQALERAILYSPSYLHLGRRQGRSTETPLIGQGVGGG